MKRTKSSKKKLTRTKFYTKSNKMQEETKNIRVENQLVYAAMAYNKGLGPWLNQQTIETLLAYCHPTDRVELAKVYDIKITLSGYNNIPK